MNEDRLLAAIETLTAALHETKEELKNLNKNIPDLNELLDRIGQLQDTPIEQVEQPQNIWDKIEEQTALQKKRRTERRMYERRKDTPDKDID